MPVTCLKVIWYRVFQFAIYKVPCFLKWRKPLLLSGPGCLGSLPGVLRDLKLDNVLVVTDRGLMETHLPDRLLTMLEQARIKYTLFDGVSANPTVECVDKAQQKYIDSGCRGFVAFGGGSPIDTAKAAAVRVARPDRQIADMSGFYKVGRVTPPVIAVPTTAGTGSEITIAAVITDGCTHRKYTVNDPHLIPVCAVLDPELTVSLPPMMTAVTGMDALTHAVEAYITVGVSRHCRRMAEEAVGLIYANIEEAYRSGANLDARQNMLLASYKAGEVFTRTGLTYAHPLAHALGGLYNGAHGLLNAVILPVVLEAFGSRIDRKLKRLLAASGMKTTQMTERDAAVAFIDSIRLLNRRLNIPDKLDCIRPGDIPLLVQWTLAEANPWYRVPKVFGEDEITSIIRQIMA